MRDMTADIRSAVDQGDLPATGLLRSFASFLGLTIELPEKYPTKEQKNAAWASIQAAVAAEGDPEPEPEPAPTPAPAPVVKSVTPPPEGAVWQVVKSRADDPDAPDEVVGSYISQEAAEAAIPQTFYWVRKAWKRA